MQIDLEEIKKEAALIYNADTSDIVAMTVLYFCIFKKVGKTTQQAIEDIKTLWKACQNQNMQNIQKN